VRTVFVPGSFVLVCVSRAEAQVGGPMRRTDQRNRILRSRLEDELRLAPNGPIPVIGR